MSIRLIVGLGNPGKKYEWSRHNIGFMTVDRIFEKHSIDDSWSNKHQGLLANASIAAQDILLLKPTTMMNSSGDSVRQVCKYYSISTQEIIVIHDDIDLSFATMKIKEGGRDGGHNGLRSIDLMNGNIYRRLRFGVGRPESENVLIGLNRTVVSKYVLSNFSGDEKAKIDILIEKIASRAEFLLEDLDIAKKQIGELNSDRLT